MYGYRWLLAGAALSTLAVSGAAQAAQNPPAQPAQPAPSRRLARPAPAVPPGPASSGQGNRPFGTAPSSGPTAPSSGPSFTGSPLGGDLRGGAPGSFQPPMPIRQGQPISVIVFPFGYQDAATDPSETPLPGGAGGAAAPPPGTVLNGQVTTGLPSTPPTGVPTEREETATAVTAAVKAGLLSTPTYSVISYHPLSSMVKRALAGGILRATDLSGLFDASTGSPDVQKARNVAYRLGIQSFMVGSLDTTKEPKTNTVEITVDTQLINSTTGEVMHAAVVSGAAQGVDGVPFEAVRDRAAQDAAQKVFPALGIQLVTPAPPVAPVKKGTHAVAKPKVEKPRAEKPERVSRDERDSHADRSDRSDRDVRDSEPQVGDSGFFPSQGEQYRTERRGSDRVTVSERPNRRQRDRKRSDDERSHDASPARAPRVEAPAAPQPLVAPAAPTAPDAPAQPRAVQAAPAARGNGTMPTAANPRDVQGVANTAGQPVPYGYVPMSTAPRSRAGLKVPPWLGVAGFLTGISFLL
jgi:hypothetical protein